MRSIHERSTCTADAGGHYFTGLVSSDPWGSVSYRSSSSGTSHGIAHVSTGGTGADVEGRALIIHSFTGARIACATLEREPVTTPALARGFVKYYNYHGTLTIGGSVGPVITTGVKQKFSYALSGVDPTCSSGRGHAANSCGVHIHAGKTCTADAGGHYYTGTVTSDPWTSIAYTAASDGTSVGVAEVTTGGTGVDVEGRAMVIHDYSGARVACALLEPTPTAPPVVASTFVPCTCALASHRAGEHGHLSMVRGC